jgi:hypothetical protein
MFSMAGIAVQHRSESVFTFDRNRRSRWAGIRTDQAPREVGEEARVEGGGDEVWLIR